MATGRSKHLFATVVAAAAMLLVAASAASAQDKTFELKLSHWVPPTHPLQKAMEEWGASIEKPVCVRTRRDPAATTRNSYQGSTMSLRSRPKTSHGIEKSKVRAPWSMTAATTLIWPEPSESRLRAIGACRHGWNA